MDFFFHYRNPNFQSSSSSVVITNNKSSNNSFHGKEGEIRKVKNKKPNKMNTKVKLSTDPQSVAARERRHRISEKFKILRSLIPGGDTRNMDTVSMLEEAIQYVKHLKSQIWLHQTMISFENFDNGTIYDHDAGRNCDHLDQDFHDPFGHHFHGEYHHHEMLPHLGFQEGSSFKVEDEDNMVVSLSHDHHNHHEIYP